MKRKFVFFALLAACVSATCSMCGNDSDTPEYEFPDGPEPEPEPEPDAYPHGLTVTEFADDLADGKRCLGFVATADPKANPKLRFNAVHLPVQKTPTRIHADFDSENRGKPCVTTNAGYWWAGNSLSLLVSGGVVESIENQTVTRDGKTVYPAFSELAAQAPAGYAALAERYEQFTGALDPVKPLVSWRLFSQTGTTGIFVCFTAEACVNPDTYTAWIPYTMCHELAHRQAVAAEDDANFCAYLACMASGSDDFCYSGAFGAYVYCHNALSKVDKAAASQIWSTLSDGVVTDLRAANEHYAQYEGKVQDAAQKVNDTYLKAFSEESGVQSYGEAADLLIAWYLKNNA